MRKSGYFEQTNDEGLSFDLFVESGYRLITFRSFVLSVQ